MVALTSGLIPKARATDSARSVTGSTIAATSISGHANAAGRWPPSVMRPAPTNARRNGLSTAGLVDEAHVAPRWTRSSTSIMSGRKPQAAMPAAAQPGHAVSI